MMKKYVSRKSSKRLLGSSVLIAFSALSTSALAVNTDDQRLVECCLSTFNNLVAHENRYSRDVRRFRNDEAEYERRRVAFNANARNFRRLEAQMRSCNPSVSGVNYCNSLLNQVQSIQPNLANEERWLGNQLRRLRNETEEFNRRLEETTRLQDRVHDSCERAWPVVDEIWWSACERFDISRSEWLDRFTVYRC